MMNCKDIQKYLDDYLDKDISLNKQKAFDSHLAHCLDCRLTLGEYKVVRRALHLLPVASPSANLEKNIFAEVRRCYPRHQRRLFDYRFITGFATAMVAGFVLWFTSTIYTPKFDVQTTQTVRVAINQMRTVKLIFNAPADLSKVALKLELPENVELQGYAGLKQLAWQTRLNKGQNILELPIIATSNGQGELIAQLNYGNKSRLFRIVLKTTDNDAFIYYINQFKSV
jgi:hypothetical protein